MPSLHINRDQISPPRLSNGPHASEGEIQDHIQYPAQHPSWQVRGAERSQLSRADYQAMGQRCSQDRIFQGSSIPPPAFAFCTSTSMASTQSTTPIGLVATITSS